ncbi:ABC transporter permease [Pseudokineococcus lusitanus]|uniref:ABC-2 type transport system permease protein n=1 Tax=Pseudokineococcus lusitanus TaxID=763993 RepID=A0A3N1HJV4_9ACTN|nr:ABC transporter permease [Pseudokineococcus lusitanus]ROP42803.1 ABC-2 type transport system permease protein [Pseudokineococcus lusitanus]
MSSLAPARPDGPDAARTPGALRLVALHTRAQVVETARVPIALVGTLVFPTLVLLFFVVPQPFAQDPAPATAAVAQISLFAVISVCLFTYGVGVAEDRALPWDPYLRTLPVGAGPRLAGRLLNGLGFALASLVPVVGVASLLTAATLPAGRLLLTGGALALAALPMLGLGLAIGYGASTKAALALAQLLLLPLAFGGGLFLPPELFPTWLDALSTWLPTRAGRDLVVAASTGTDLSTTALPVLAAWTVLTGALAVLAYRRDEGRRFR